MKKTGSALYLAQAAVIAALYIVLTVLLAPISYGLVQVRVAEALTVLPVLTPVAVPALFIGCLIANIFGGLGLVDILGGSTITLLAAFATYSLRHRPDVIPLLPPVLFNAFLLSIYLHVILKVPYWLMVLSIGAGQTVAVYGLGLPLLRYLKKRRLFPE
jgi:uncharacterized membrane protein